MEDRLKERLTGAILLVVLVVVLVPAMFRGERQGAAGASAATGAGQQQVYTIDLKGAAPAVAEAPAATQPAALPAEPTPPAAEPAATTPVAASPAVTPPSPPAQPNAPPAPVPAQRVAAVAPKPAGSQPAPPAKPAVTKPPAAKAATESGGFVVQVGTFSKRENAAVMVRQAAKKGARLIVAGPDDRGLFRVRTTVVRTRQEAVALQEKLLSQGYKGLVGSVN